MLIQEEMLYTLPAPNPLDAREIDQIAHRALQKAGCIGVLPTPLDDVLGALDIKRAPGLTEFFKRQDAANTAGATQLLQCGLEKN